MQTWNAHAQLHYKHQELTDTIRKDVNSQGSVWRGVCHQEGPRAAQGVRCI